MEEIEDREIKEEERVVDAEITDCPLGKKLKIEKIHQLIKLPVYVL